MAVIRRAPYGVGDIGKLWPTDEQSEWVDITAPDGQQMRLRRTPPGAVKVWLLQAGEWVFDWGAGDTGTLEVTQRTELAPPPAPAVVRATRWPPPRGV